MSEIEDIVIKDVIVDSCCELSLYNYRWGKKITGIEASR